MATCLSRVAVKGALSSCTVVRMLTLAEAETVKDRVWACPLASGIPLCPAIASQALAVPLGTSSRHWPFSTRDWVLAPFHQEVVPELKFPLRMSSVVAAREVLSRGGVSDASTLAAGPQDTVRAEASVSAAREMDRGAKPGIIVWRKRTMNPGLSRFVD